MKRLALLSCLLLASFSFLQAEEPPVPVNVASAIPPQPPMKTIAGPGGTVIIHDMPIDNIGGFPILIDMAYLKAPSPTPRPAMLIVHGGGWVGGSKTLNLNWAMKGYFVYSVNYRLLGVAKWPAQIEDVKLAVRWLRANAATYNIDPNKIGAQGHSAGGHLVCCLGTMTDPKWDVGNYQGYSSAVQCVVDMAGPIDLPVYFTKFKLNPKNLFGDFGVQHPEVLAEASPINYVRPGLPPFFIANGDKDVNVPISQAEEMVAALKKNGDSVQFVVMHGAGHSFGHAKGEHPSPSIDEFNAMIQAFIDKNLKGT